MPGLPFEAPSMLHLNQFKKGGCQQTSLRIGTLGWWILILNIFKKEKSLMELEECLEVLLPDKEVLAY
jgi:hypothetical protein